MIVEEEEEEEEEEVEVISQGEEAESGGRNQIAQGLSDVWRLFNF